MNKRPSRPSRPAPPKVNRPAGKAPPARPAIIQKRRPAGPPPPPRPMVTAAERQQQKNLRRANFAHGNNQPGFGGVAAGAAAGAAMGAAAVSAADSLQQEQSRFNAIQNQVMLSHVLDELEDIEGAIGALPANVENIRARGYVFKSYLEKKVETLTSQWRDLRPRVEAAVQQQQMTLRNEATRVQMLLSRRQPAGAALSGLETQVGAASRTLEGMYDTLDDNVNQTQQQLDDISWSLQQIEMASFGCLPTEAVVEAVPANWKKPGDKDGVEGVLILTDQRLLFEQKEEVATKKVLFFTTEKQKVQALAWEVPVVQIDKAVGSKRGLMNKDDFLTLTLQSGAGLKSGQGQPLYDEMGRPLGTAEVHLKGESGDAWQGFIGRVKSGEVAKERTEPVDEAVAESLSNAPTKCPNCGATITQTILRGQTEITCEFCGSVIRL
jgi:predicted  nucleic acid-binding Zn-ribbon protein